MDKIIKLVFNTSPKKEVKFAAIASFTLMTKITIGLR